MPLPPGVGPFPGGTALGATPNAPMASVKVANLAPGGVYIIRGPYRVQFVPATENVATPSPVGGGNMVQASQIVWLPRASAVRARSIVTNVGTGLTYSVIEARAVGGFVECLLERTQADL